ncbi:MAG: hypothetical protein WDM85_15525 [Caulobacteraceae bacterium]
MTRSRLTAAALVVAPVAAGAAGAASAQPAGGAALRQVCMPTSRRLARAPTRARRWHARVCQGPLQGILQPCQTALMQMRARMQQQQNSNSAPAAGGQ